MLANKKHTLRKIKMNTQHTKIMRCGKNKTKRKKKIYIYIYIQQPNSTPQELQRENQTAGQYP
jgi:hypothetical protein